MTILNTEFSSCSLFETSPEFLVSGLPSSLLPPRLPLRYCLWKHSLPDEFLGSVAFEGFGFLSDVEDFLAALTSAVELKIDSPFESSFVPEGGLILWDLLYLEVHEQLE